LFNNTLFATGHHQFIDEIRSICESGGLLVQFVGSFSGQKPWMKVSIALGKVKSAIPRQAVVIQVRQRGKAVSHYTLILIDKMLATTFILDPTFKAGYISLQSASGKDVKIVGGACRSHTLYITQGNATGI
jgi:hypothetical protein